MLHKMITIRTVFFVLFFASGAASLGLSVLCEDLLQYYQNRQLARAARQSLEKLKSLNDDYNMLLAQLAEDPNLIKRLAPPYLHEQTDPNTVYPRATARQLAAARRALTDPNQEAEGPAIPGWLDRCSDPPKRLALFISGIALILISFICFRPAAAIL